MAKTQSGTERYGMVPEDNPPEFFAKHLSAYHFAKKAAAGKKVLEIGFGDGYGMNYLAGTARDVTGIDIAPMNIPLAREKYPAPNLAFLHYDGANFPFAPGSFDLVCTFQVIEHVPEPRLGAWLSEIRRVLRDDGAFYVSTLNLKNAMKPGCAYEKNLYHEKEFTARGLEELLKTAFGRVTMYGLHYAPGHRFFRRLKKWGLLGVPAVRNHFRRVTVDDFRVIRGDADRSVDLFAVCQKGGQSAL